MVDTIFALATAPGRAAVAVIRLSGPGSGEALEKLAGRRSSARRAVVVNLRRPGDGAIVDRALVTWYPGPASYTGEDSVELHLHGGAAVIDGVTEALIQLGLRLAEPGEFTRRAFENGKLDLAQAEAVADLVDAETEGQRRQALGQLDGDLTRRHAHWRSRLVEALAVLEAAVDFPDEDLPEAIALEAVPIVAGIAEELVEALDDAARGERVREGFHVAIVGAPNAGKSSLLNALLGRDAAIVTATPGTTRDVIEAPLNLAGYRVLIADTAGLRQARNPIETEGVRRAEAWAERADLRLVVIDSNADDPSWRAAIPLVRAGDLCLMNKRDLPAGREDATARSWALGLGLDVLDTVLGKGGGVVDVKTALTAKVTSVLAGAEFPAATRARHRHDLVEAHGHLLRAMRALERPIEVELAAEDVRLAARSLARISGRVDAEDVLDRVFARFCIGK